MKLWLSLSSNLWILACVVLNGLKTISSAEGEIPPSQDPSAQTTSASAIKIKDETHSPELENSSKTDEIVQDARKEIGERSGAMETTTELEKAIKIGHETHRPELENSSDDDKIVQDARKEIGETSRAMETAKEEEQDESANKEKCVQKDENPEAVRVCMQDVSKYSHMFLTEVKVLPSIKMEEGTYRLELEDPPYDEKLWKEVREKVGETPERMETTKQELVKLLKDDTDINMPWENDAWVIRFLRLRNYDVTKAHELIRNYYYFKAEHKYIYDGLVPSKVLEVAELEALGVLPNRDPKGRRIFLSRAKNWDPWKYDMLQSCQIGILLSETGAYEPATQLAGVMIIFDVSGLTLRHYWMLDYATAKRIVYWLLNCAPFRYEEIHIVKQPLVFWGLYKYYERSMTDELRSKIFIHGRNMKSLHKHIPPSSLPKEYGGSLPMPSLSHYEWDVLLRTGDEEYAKIDSYGVKSESSVKGKSSKEVSPP